MAAIYYFMRRCEKRLPSDILHHILSFVPSMMRSLIRSGFRVFQTIPLSHLSPPPLASAWGTDVMRKYTFLPTATAIKIWRKKWRWRHGGKKWKDVVVMRYTDSWYGKKCVILSTGHDRYKSCFQHSCAVVRWIRINPGFMLAYGTLSPDYKVRYDAATNSSTIHFPTGYISTPVHVLEDTIENATIGTMQ